MERQGVIMNAISLSVVLLFASSAFAGPDWTEVPPDARKNPPGQTITLTPVNSISGSLMGLDSSDFPPLASLGFGPDVADLYRITVAGTTTVTTGGGGGGSADFDTILALFCLDGTGHVANDDVSPTDTSSRITIPGPGTYFLAIAVKGVQPVSAGGNIFNFTTPGAQFAQVPANGPGRLQPLLDWPGTPVNPEPRNYVISLSRGVPTLSELSLWVMGVSFVIGASFILRRGIAGV